MNLSRFSNVARSLRGRKARRISYSTSAYCILLCSPGNGINSPLRRYPQGQGKAVIWQDGTNDSGGKS
jgi:hypothetical protein